MGGLELKGTAAGGGAVSVSTAGDAFGSYSLTYTASKVEAVGTDEVTVSVLTTEISEKVTVKLTPVPPKEVRTLVISGFVYKSGGTVPVPGVQVTVKAGTQESETTTAGNGLYEATFFGLLAPVAKTGDLISVVVMDSKGRKRGQVEAFPLSDQHLDADSPDLANIDKPITTNIGSMSNSLSVSGKVYLDDGETAAGSGVSVKVENADRGLSQSVLTDRTGSYAVEFSDEAKTVSETDDVLTFTVSLGDKVFTASRKLTSADVEGGLLDYGIQTDFPATANETFVVYGTVLQVDGQASARAGLKVVV